VKLKGVGLKNTLAALERLHGKEGLARVKEAMPPRLVESLSLILPVEWYPLEITAALHLAIRDTVGGGKWDESHRISVEAAQLELKGVYRMVLRALQYDSVWDKMESMWRQYYDAGEAKWVDRGEGHATAEFHGVAGFNEGMWRSVGGRIEVMLEATGARGQSTTVKVATSTHATIELLWLV
jgi:hypothetical protein